LTAFAEHRPVSCLCTCRAHTQTHIHMLYTCSYHRRKSLVLYPADLHMLCKTAGLTRAVLAVVGGARCGVVPSRVVSCRAVPCSTVQYRAVQPVCTVPCSRGDDAAVQCGAAEPWVHHAPLAHIAVSCWEWKHIRKVLEAASARARQDIYG
jgi:hypothetical protein